MAVYQKSVGGAWLDADKHLKDGVRVKLVSECEKQQSRFKDPKTGEFKMENVAKVRVEGVEDALNARLNWATIYGLIDAFGSESKEWVNKPLTAKLVDAMVGDTMRTIIYLIPEGFELTKNKDKKLVITKMGAYPDEESDDIPF